jgi:DNA primase
LTIKILYTTIIEKEVVSITSEQLKSKLNEEFVIKILSSIGCHSIKKQKINQKNIIVAANPLGDNTTAINVYLDNFLARNYTKTEFESKPYKDIITLVEFLENKSSQQAIKRICEICNFDYYCKQEETPNFLKWLQFVETGVKNKVDNENIIPLPESILNQFRISPVKKWRDEGISVDTQADFQIGLDIMTERIIIPIRDEIGSLVGVKGRLLKDEKIDDDKYVYIYSCPKTKILYGLYKNYKHIKEANEVIVVESEKGVLKLKSLGFNNAVAIGSKSISKTQIDKLLRLCVPITIAFDKDVTNKEIETIVKELKFPLNIVDVYVISDKMNLLSKKESPMDNAETWQVLYENFKFKM